MSMTLHFPRRVAPGAGLSDSSQQLLRAAFDSVGACARPLVVEAGTGAGTLACALAAARADALVYATDESELALSQARRNQRQFALWNVHFRLGPLLTPLPLCLHAAVDLVLSSLPYAPPCLASAESQLLPPGTPCGAGEDGLRLLRTLAVTARDFLMPGGSLVFQLGSFQWYGFAQQLTDLGYEEVQVARRAHNVITARAIWA